MMTKVNCEASGLPALCSSRLHSGSPDPPASIAGALTAWSEGRGRGSVQMGSRVAECKAILHR